MARHARGRKEGGILALGNDRLTQPRHPIPILGERHRQVDKALIIIRSQFR